MTSPNHTNNLCIPSRKMGNGNRRCSGSAHSGKVIATNQCLQNSGIWIEQKNCRLMIGQTIVGIMWPVATRLHTKNKPGAVKAGLETIERISMANGLSDNWKVLGLPLAIAANTASTASNATVWSITC